jgi:hypothetical protein
LASGRLARARCPIDIGLFSSRDVDGGTNMNGRFSEIALRKDGETYIFRFDDVSHRAFLNVLGRFAADPNLSFSWHDAAVLCKKVRQQCPQVVGTTSAAIPNRLG